MTVVPVTIRKYVDTAQPGWVECCLVDASGQEWIFVEKVPVVTDRPLGPDSDFPQPGLLACQVLGTREDSALGKIATVDTNTPWGVESVDNRTTFDVLLSTLRVI